jgi:5-carboxymethyl-2-hydroxymuconate isomerase
MPHLTLEITDNVDQPIAFDQLFAELHQVLASVAGIRIDNCKGRALRRKIYYIGDGGAGKAFVHLEICILESRTAETKRAVGEQCLQVLQRHFARSSGQLELQITLEVRDMPPAAYFKAAA